MMRYTGSLFDEEYIQTLGINYSEKSLSLKDTRLNFNVWDLGGPKEFAHMLPILTEGAHAVVFAFDLTRKFTLLSLKEWYRQVSGLSAHGIVPLLVGTKYDLFETMPIEFKQDLVATARRYAKAMGGAPLVFCSASRGQNISAVFKIILSKLFNISCTLPRLSDELNGPILEY
eukprot:TRINITY_DN1238_c0_g1_i3.p1 TRINITY_DN1238_c0_g1~~TRINITY_DN1238_c0_g1_i3.p1  ORF type:complete len:173 (-),score=30.88 TRINITY_DN1238_c0_g1_i3:12-530(-)